MMLLNAQKCKISEASGFTLLEVIISLVIAGIMAVVAAMGLVSFTKGLIFAKESSHTAQKVQLAMSRLNFELMELTNIAARDDTQPDPHVIYDNKDGRHAIAKDGTTIKMFFNLASGAVTLPGTAGDILIDNVGSLSFNYYKDYQNSTPWVLGTDDIDLLTAVEIDLTLTGIGGTFSTIVYPRNT